MQIVNDGHESVNFSPQAFLQWEGASRDTIDVKLIYIDMAGDLTAGFVLSQIIYWHLPNKDGHSKLRVQHDGHLWVAKKRDGWWGECRVTARQIDRVMKILEDRNLVETMTRKFNGDPMLHVRIRWPEFLKAWQEQLGHKASGDTEQGSGLHQTVKTTSTECAKPTLPIGEDDFTPAQTPGTETTTKSTQENTTTTPVEPAAVVAVAHAPSNDLSPEDEALADALYQAGYKPKSAAREAVASHAGLARAWLREVQGSAGLKNPGGYLRKRIASGEWPPRTPEPDAPRPKRISAAEKRARHAAVYESIWSSLTEKLRADVEREGHDKYEYIEKHHYVELNDRIRQSGKHPAENPAKRQSG